MRPIGFEAVEIARVEAGLIIHEQDYLAGEQTPYDVGLDRLVKLDEAEPFLGREALRAIAAAPPNRFVTLRLSGDELPELGADVLLDGEVVGCLTSPVESPRHGLIGLARVRTDAAADGAQRRRRASATPPSPRRSVTPRCTTRRSSGSARSAPGRNDQTLTR